MEERLNAWLKTYRTEATISPVDWESVPDECRVRLEQYARDQAVQRADRFADTGELDLRRQEAVRQFVDAMALSWRLPGEDVRRIVEDFFDELIPQPGQEFEKLAVRLFRRELSATAAELFNRFDPAEEHPVITNSFRYLDVPPNHRLDRKGFLHALHLAYDAWTNKQPKEAVQELLETCNLDAPAIALKDIIPFLEMRGARVWRKALMVEEDIGVEDASSEELVRILKRYALLVRRGGLEAIGLGPAESVPEAEAEAALTPQAESTTDPAPKTEPAAEAVAPPTHDSEEQEEEVAPPPPADPPEAKKKNDVTFEFRPPEVEDVVLPIPEEAAEDSDEPTAEAAKVEDDVDMTTSAAAEEPSDAVAQDEPPAAESEEDLVNFHFDDETLNNLTSRDKSALKKLFGGGGKVRAAMESEADPAPTVVAEPPDIPDEELEVAESIAGPNDEDLGWDTSIKSRGDRFAGLRSGELRDKVVKAIYDGDDTQFDIFLAQLSAATDWETGKQFIAREMHRQHVNLEIDPAKQLFFALKKSMSGPADD